MVTGVDVGAVVMLGVVEVELVTLGGQEGATGQAFSSQTS
jgi:hypothetical protein